MKTNRRDFIKTAGVAGSGVMAGGLASSCSSATAQEPKPTIFNLSKGEGKQVFNMSGFSAPPLKTVRIGIIGIGNRGYNAIMRLRFIEGVEIKALCDLYMDRVEKGQKLLDEMGFPKAKAYADGNEKLWQTMVQDSDLDVIYITTPRAQHAEQCVFSMNNGKHAATEIPAAATLEECWQLVETSEKTKKHCSMIENCTYDFFELLVLNMVRQGMLGEIVHVDCAYTADQRQLNLDKTLPWRLREMTARNGSLYPTHGIGPACQVLNVNRGDRLDFLTSMSSNDFTMGPEIARRAQEDDYYKPFVGTWKLGNMNVTTIRTVNGKTIMMQYNVANPRPGTRIYWVVGTKGIAKKQPFPSRMSFGKGWIKEEEMKELEKKFSPPIVSVIGEMAKKVGGHGGMDFLKDWRLIDCLRNGIPLDQDVYDAAACSSIVPLSEWSVANMSAPVRIPDFTRGSYKTNVPLDIEMKGGGNTGVKPLTKVLTPDDRGYKPA